jgi:hypothetical protein
MHFSDYLASLNTLSSRICCAQRLCDLLPHTNDDHRNPFDDSACEFMSKPSTSITSKGGLGAGRQCDGAAAGGQATGSAAGPEGEGDWEGVV